MNSQSAALSHPLVDDRRKAERRVNSVDRKATAIGVLLEAARLLRLNKQWAAADLVIDNAEALIEKARQV